MIKYLDFVTLVNLVDYRIFIISSLMITYGCSDHSISKLQGPFLQDIYELFIFGFY
jgi:hypothetical protein